jgi:hypothetical protein
MVELVFLVAFNQGRSPNVRRIFQQKNQGGVAPTAHITDPPPPRTFLNFLEKTMEHLWNTLKIKFLKLNLLYKI